MSVFNQDKFLNKSINSILQQTYNNFDFLILNDGSFDNSGKIIKKFKDKRIKYYENKKRLGLTKCLNILIDKTKTDYIARMDGDDISLPNRIGEQIMFLKKNIKFALVGSWAKIINSKGEIIGEFKYPSSYKLLRRAILSYNPFIHPSIMFKKKNIIKIGGYDENLFYCQDYDLFLRLMQKYPCANLKKYLLKFRWQEDYEKQKKQHFQALKIRWSAICKYGYSKWEMIKLIKPLALYLIPINLKKSYWAKKYYHKNEN